MELFFDLVYVFAVTQLSQTLLHHLTARGALETLVLFGAVWWAWNYTAWATNWIDPDHPRVRALLVVLMLIGLIMSAAIPEAFHDRAWTFAGAYVALQALRSAFMVVAFGSDRMARNYAQLLAWTSIAGVFWLAGALADGDARLGLWILALLLDLGAPMHGFALPRFGGTPIEDWTLAGGHLAERCHLVLLIAIGESVLAVGSTFGDAHATVAVVAAFVVGFAGTVSLWWIYFVRHAEVATRAIAGAETQAARIGRAGYAYAHAVMVGGVIVVAVAIDRTIAHPGGTTSAATAAVVLGGPALYLAGNAMFKRTVSGGWPPSRAVAIAALAVLVPFAHLVSPLALSAGAALVTVALAARESMRSRLGGAL
ncbi:MAG: low temperature requirement protein [Solirubrobacterales bacterium]|nr:low temperature requirement protein [Solirubrobacterales bacterium]